MKHAKQIVDMMHLMFLEIDVLQAKQEKSWDKCDIKVPDMFSIIVRNNISSVKILTSDEDMMIGGFLVSNHGHNGINGGRGLAGLSTRSAIKSIDAHTHSARRIDGHITVGTQSELNRNYTKGLSTWSNTDAIITANDKAQLITYKYETKDFRINGKTTSKGTLMKYAKTVNYKPALIEEKIDTNRAKAGENLYEMTDIMNGNKWKGTGYRDFEFKIKKFGKKRILALMKDARKNTEAIYTDKKRSVSIRLIK